MDIFQFTASYEADRMMVEMFVNGDSFNSQPHTRLTSIEVCKRLFPNVFQFTASYEADHVQGSITLLNRLFQFTASYEADLYLGFPNLKYHTFNSQPHTRLTSKNS